ncbi:hypothetical protein AAG570_013780, partial [Ranatra chinensis]
TGRQFIHSTTITCLYNYSLHVAGIINRGDSFRKRRSRSNSLAGGAPPQVTLTPVNSPGTGPAYRVAMIGAQGVGKTALVSQFMTSECINAYDRQRGTNNYIIKLD